MKSRLPKEWKICTAEVALEKIIDYRGRTPKKSKKGIATLSARSVKNNYIDFEKVYYISEQEYEEFMTRGFPQIGDVVLTTEAPLGLITQLKTDNIALGQRLLTIRGKENLVDNGYLKYYFQSIIGQHELHSRSTGTTVLGISQKNFRKCEIILPSIEEQELIAKTLSALENKIEINLKINKKLKMQTKFIFKLWFLEFEFPDVNGNPYKSCGGKMVESESGLIPKEWELVELSDIAQRQNGYSYKSIDLNEEAQNNLMTLKNFNRNGDYNYKEFRGVNITDRVRSHHFVNDGDILLACTDLTQKGEVVGNPIKYFSTNKFDKVIYSMDLVKIIPKVANRDFFIYYALQDRNFKEYAKNHAAGTTVLHLNKKSIDNFKMVIPKENIINIFEDVARTIEEKITKNYKQNEKLSQIRDLLLPKLLSGEIRIPLD